MRGDGSRLRLVTRGSRLALAQTDLTVAVFKSAGLTNIDVVVVETSGDRNWDTPAASMEGQGWFTAEIERALLDGRADCAVHSAKDLPGELAPTLMVAAYLERADPRDALVSAGGVRLAELPVGSRVATSSPRRAAMARAANPGVQVVPIRGNVDTRLRKFREGAVNALLIACAGLDRLGIGDCITERLDPRFFVPAPAQGAIALQVCEGSHVAVSIGEAADHGMTRTAIVAERTLLAVLGGGCLLPLGAFARVEDGRLVLSAALEVAGELRHVEVAGEIDAPQALGELAARNLNA